MDLKDLNWDDVRVFAATARAQSFRQAAEQLKLSHPTVRRRLESLEAATGLTLFHRGVDGLHPTLEGQELLDATHEVERAMQGLARRAQAANASVSGPLTVTVPLVVAMLLSEGFGAFAVAHPEIRLRVVTDESFADLSRMEADIAIRVMMAGRSPDPSLAGRRALAAHAAVYGQPGCTHWLAPSTDPDWVRNTPFPDLPIRCVMGDTLLRAHSCRQGLGLARVPCFMLDGAVPRLSEPAAAFDLWVLVHPDLRRNPRLKLFRDAMVEALERHGPLLRGETVQTAQSAS